MKLAEQNVISGLLTNDNIDYVYDSLKPEMFEDALLGKMYYILMDANKKKESADITYLSQRLTELPEDIVNNELIKIAGLMPLGFEIKAEVQTIISDYQARKANRILSETSINGANVYEEAESLIKSLSDIVKPANNGKSLFLMVEKHKANCFVPKENGHRIGFMEVDMDLGGLEPGDLIVIGARPSVGKTSFAVLIADYMAKCGIKTMLFNLEMSEKQIYERMVSRESGIPLYRIRTGTKYLNDEEEIRFSAANEVLSRMPNLIFVTGGQTVSEIKKSIKEAKAEVIIIDYLQLITPENSYKGNRYAEVGAISHGLKAIARDLNIPVIVLTQLNREVEKRRDKKPTMADLRESGDVEQDASVIMLLWNENEEDGSRKCLKIEKNRQGTKGMYHLDFDGSRMIFTQGGWQETDEKEDLPFEPDKE